MQSREDYVEQLKQQLDNWNAEVGKWEAKTKDAQADMRVASEKQLEEFRRQRDQAMEQMRLIQNASGDAWTQLIRSTDDVWAKTREAYDKAFSQFRK